MKYSSISVRVMLLAWGSGRPAGVRDETAAFDDGADELGGLGGQRNGICRGLASSICACGSRREPGDRAASIFPELGDRRPAEQNKGTEPDEKFRGDLDNGISGGVLFFHAIFPLGFLGSALLTLAALKSGKRADDLLVINDLGTHPSSIGQEGKENDGEKIALFQEKRSFEAPSHNNCSETNN